MRSGISARLWGELDGEREADAVGAGLCGLDEVRAPGSDPHGANISTNPTVIAPRTIKDIPLRCPGGVMSDPTVWLREYVSTIHSG